MLRITAARVVLPFWLHAGCRGDAVSASSTTGHSADSSSTAFSETVASTSAQTSAAQESGTTSASADVGSADECGIAELSVEHSSAGVIAPDWPTGPTLNASCDAIAIEDDDFVLLLHCAHPETGAPTTVRLSVSEGAVNGRLDWLPGTKGLRLSFYSRPPDAITCPFCSDLSLRDASGGLVVRGQVLTLLDAVPADSARLEMTGPGWLDPMSQEYAGFSEPFSEITLDNVGCAARESLRPGSESETPLAVSFVFEGGAILLYDRNARDSVPVGDGSFDLRVSDAFFRGPLNCGDCPSTEAHFLILRSLAE